MDMFCDAMINIRKEIEMASKENPNNVLKNAPHTLEMITSSNWDLTYSREEAAFPLPFVRDNKFRPSVRRIDDAFGDRNLICSCPKVETYA